MSGIFSTFNTANKGLLAQQAALHTTGHNISNSKTAGFSRQRVEMKADLAFNYIGVGQLGTGVKIDGVVRLVDDYVSKQIRQENSVFGKYNTKSDVLTQVEIVFNEPSDTGINFNLGEMFDAWQELSKNPESLTQKMIVVEKSKTLADSLNHMSKQLNTLKDNTVEEIDKNVMDFNATVDKLDSLNKQIFNVAIKGQVPNDLLDQRDMLLLDLSGMTDISTNFDKFGRAEVSIDKQVVLDATTKNNIKIDIAEVDGEIVPNISLVDGDKNVVATVKVGSGQITGNIDGLDETNQRLKELDKFAENIANVLNEAHKQEMEPGKEIADIDIFTKGESPDAKITAGNIQVNIAVSKDNNLITAGKSSSVDSPEGDGSRALKIAGLRMEKIIDGTTIEGAYSSIVTKVGISKQYADNMVKNQEVLLDHLMLRRESTSGVSINEEVTNVVKFQKAFEANAKVISVLAEMLDTLINRMGV